MKQIKYSFLLISLLLTITGCSNEDKADTKVSENSRTITHDLGTTVINGKPQRVVTLFQGATDSILALGITPVGVVESWVQKPKYDYLKDRLDGVPVVGLETQPNLEEIAKLKPDLIIASTIRHKKIYDQLTQIAPTVTTATVFEFKKTLNLIGESLDIKSESEKLLSDWDKRVMDFKKAAPDNFGGQWPIETAVLNFRVDHARVYITGFAGSILKELGFVKPEIHKEAENEGKVILKLVTKESIPSMDADVFFLFIASPGKSKYEEIIKNYNEWIAHPLWTNLKAIKNDRTYIVDDVIWNMGGGIISANLMLDDLYKNFINKNEI